MTNPDHTFLALVVDRSGSMETIRRDMDGAIANLIADQQAQPGTCELYVAEFDDHYDLVYHGDIATAHDITIKPRGTTALLGAIGRTVDDVGVFLMSRRESERPSKVLVAIISDGMENASQHREWSRQYVGDGRIRQMIKHQSDAYQWVFVFVGANQDAVAAASDMGIPGDQALTFSANTAGTQSATTSLSSTISTYRSSGTYKGFSDEDRAKANT